MKKGLYWIGFGLAGLTLALGLSLAAFAFTGSDISRPARPLIRQVQEHTQTPSAKPSKSDEPKHTPSANPTQAPSPVDDHGGSSGSDDSGSDDHGGGDD